jgi:hypothetical protein
MQTAQAQIDLLLAAAFHLQIGPQRDAALQVVVQKAQAVGIGLPYVQSRVGELIQQSHQTPHDGDRMLGQVVEILGRFGIALVAVGVLEGPRAWVLQFLPDDTKNMVKVAAIEQRLDDLSTRISGFVNPIVIYKTPIEIHVQKRSWQPCHLIDYVSIEDTPADAPFQLTVGVRMNGAIQRIAVEHIQIAGTPGSGKTALQNALIGDVMLRYPPWLCQWVFIDVEKVGLKGFNGLPWFWRGRDGSLPDRAITSPGTAYQALTQLLGEHDRRLDLLDGADVDDIYRYNRKQRQSPLPHLMCLIDEAWAFRHNAGRDLFPEMESLDAQIKAGETAVDRQLIEIAQRCRKTGIHLIIATQRASQDVLNPLLRASLSTKIALKAADEGSSAVALGYKCDWAIRLGKKGDFWLVHEDGVDRCQALYVDRDEPIGVNGETRLEELIQGGYFKYRRWAEAQPQSWEKVAPSTGTFWGEGGRSRIPEPLRDRASDELAQYREYRRLADQGLSKSEILITLFGHRHDKPETAAAGNSRRSYRRRIEDWQRQFGPTGEKISNV